MPDRLTRFLIELSRDPTEMAAFAREPERVLARAELTDEEKDLLRGDDVESLFRHLGTGAAVFFGAGSQSQSQQPPPGPKPPHEPPPKPPKPREAAGAEASL